MINLIPMAGRGSRFFQESYRIPKPFVPVLGKPMFVTAVKSFPMADKYIFICLEEHVKKYRMPEIVRHEFSNPEIVIVDAVTEGPACTCLLAESLISQDDGLFIASCDYQVLYDKEKYDALLADDSIDIIIWTFKIGNIKKANPNGFAYCRTEGNRVIEVVEKKTISDNPAQDYAVVGSFTYKRGSDFVSGAKQMIKKNIRINNEFYVATSINQLVASGRRVVVFEVDQFISFGNPFELAMFRYWQEYFDAIEDHPYSMASNYRKLQGVEHVSL